MAQLAANEVLFAEISGENSDFVRLNQNRVRQAGHVQQATLTLNLITGQQQADQQQAGQKQVEASCDLTYDAEQDLAQALHMLRQLRERLQFMPPDPFLHYSTVPDTSEHTLSAELPDPQAAIADLISAADGLDLVGIWASGDIYTGLASSLGHRHWHAAQSFNLDWSVYLQADKALKANYSGMQWQLPVLKDKLARMRKQLTQLARPARVLPPGRYRAYLEPAAVGEWVHMLGWGGFDLKSQRTFQTPLLRLLRGERTFARAIHLSEETRRGLMPRFTGEGFLLPDEVPLLSAGQAAEALTTARDGKEFDLPVNAASGAPQSLSMGPGDLDRDHALAALDTGLWIGNLWYCNWSDLNDCRITGMTRFGTFWVEGGEVVAPVAVMRFDDSLYHLWGEQLEAMTQQRELLISTDTYGGRSIESALLPGQLISAMHLTL